MTGPYLHSLEVSKIPRCALAIQKDPIHFGFKCTSSLLKYEELNVEYPTDITRLKKEAQSAYALRKSLDESAVPNADYLVIYNATILTMDTGYLKTDVLRDALVVVRSGAIEAIIGIHDADAADYVPLGATTFDAKGAYVIPGFIDVHAHWNGFADYYPSRSWELETFLAYGVTTLHKYVSYLTILC